MKILLPIWLLWQGAFLITAQNGIAASTSAVDRIERDYVQGQARFNKNTNDAAAAWEFGMACFELADLPSSEAGRARIAHEGIAACRQAITLSPKLSAAHYYLAMNLGELARTKTVGALKLLPEMESQFLVAIDLGPDCDYGGPYRSLGLLYLDAPGWPASIGNKTKARLYLRKAVELRPDFPENSLCLLEAYLKWNEKTAVQERLASTEETLQRARKVLTGEKWELSWEDWDRRWAKIKAKVPDTDLENPKQKK